VTAPCFICCVHKLCKGACLPSLYDTCEMFLLPLGLKLTIERKKEGKREEQSGVSRFSSHTNQVRTCLSTSRDGSLSNILRCDVLWTFDTHPFIRYFFCHPIQSLTFIHPLTKDIDGLGEICSVSNSEMGHFVSYEMVSVALQVVDVIELGHLQIMSID